jgi:uncharacterized protein
MTNSMENKLREDLKAAMIGKDETRVSTIRLLLSELTYAKVAKKAETLSDEDVISVIQKAVKQRKESIASYKSGGREDLASKEQAELEILEAYLPEQMSDEELTKIVDESITNTGASTIADMGKVIGMVMGKVGQKAEGARVSAFVRSKLAS